MSDLRTVSPMSKQIPTIEGAILEFLKKRVGSMVSTEELRRYVNSRRGSFCEPGTVTKMLWRLRDDGLIDYERSSPRTPIFKVLRVKLESL